MSLGKPCRIQKFLYGMLILRKGCVTLLILGVKGHTFACIYNTGKDHQKPALRHVRWEFQSNMAVHEQSLSVLADELELESIVAMCWALSMPFCGVTTAL